VQFADVARAFGAQAANALLPPINYSGPARAKNPQARDCRRSRQPRTSAARKLRYEAAGLRKI